MGLAFAFRSFLRFGLGYCFCLLVEFTSHIMTSWRLSLDKQQWSWANVQEMAFNETGVNLHCITCNPGRTCLNFCISFLSYVSQISECRSNSFVSLNYNFKQEVFLVQFRIIIICTCFTLQQSIFHQPYSFFQFILFIPFQKQTCNAVETIMLSPPIASI